MTETPTIEYQGVRTMADETQLRLGKGLDVGTANLLSAAQDTEGLVGERIARLAKKLRSD